MRRTLFTFLLVLAAVPAFAQPQVVLAQDQLTSLNDTVCYSNMANVVSFNIQVSNTLAGTVTFQGTATNGPLVSIEGANVATGATSATTTAAGVFAFTNTGYQTVCATMTSYTSGGVNVTISRGYGAGGAGGGGGASFDGVLLDAAGGDPVTDTATNAINVKIVDGGGTGGTAIADDADFADGTTVGTPVGGVAEQAAPSTVTEGDFGWAAITLNRALKTSLFNAAGTAAFGAAGTAATPVLTVQGIASMTPLLATVTATNLDVQIGGSDTVGVIGTIANDAGAAGTNRIPTLPGITENAAPTRTDGRNAALSLTTGGAVRTMLTDSAGAALTLAADATLGTTTYTEATSKAPGLVVRNDTPDSLVNTTNEISALGVNANGALWVSSIDPCSYKAKSYHVVNMSTATTVEIANAVASEFWYVCSVNLVAAAAQTIAIGHDDTDGCGSITAGMHGGATAATGWSFAANGGIALGNGSSTVMKAATASHYFCVITGQATQISGTISYVSAP